MQIRFGSLRSSLVLTLLVAFCAACLAQTPHFLITNEDNSQGNTATFYTVNSDGSLSQTAIIDTGGLGLDGQGAVATRRVSVLQTPTQSCAFISDSGSNDVAAISIPGLTLVGRFKGSRSDSNASSGIGVANNGKLLFATFAVSRTIATFRIQSGCVLNFLRDTRASGLRGGAVVDMAVHGNILVANFDDDSIQSFRITDSGPVPNPDSQFTTSHLQNGSHVGGVDITADGHFAIIGNILSPTAGAAVDVSDLSSGRLAPTVVYSNLGTGSDANTVWLSPDESLLYLGNFFSDQVSAAFFNPATGVVSGGCTSPVLNGDNFSSGLATSVQNGNGAQVYVAEADANIGIVNVSSSPGACTLSEAAFSPVFDAVTTLESIAAFPPRSF